MNFAKIIGNIGEDVKINYTKKGIMVASFTVATNERYEHEGEEKFETEWHKIACYGKAAEEAKKLKKGTFVVVMGKLRTRKWKDRKDIIRTTTEIVGSVKAYEDNKLKDYKVEPIEKSELINPSKEELIESDDSYPF